MNHSTEAGAVRKPSDERRPPSGRWEFAFAVQSATDAKRWCITLYDPDGQRHQIGITSKQLFSYRLFCEAVLDQHGDIYKCELWNNRRPIQLEDWQAELEYVIGRSPRSEVTL